MTSQGQILTISANTWLMANTVKCSLPGSQRHDSMAEQVFMGQSEARTEGREEELEN